VFDRETVIALDNAARVLGVNRQEVLERGFYLLTRATEVLLDHPHSCGGGGVVVPLGRVSL
jgi:ferredoxin